MIKGVTKRVVLIVCALLLIMPVCAYASTTKQELDEAQRREKELEKKLQSVQATINQLGKDIADMEKYIQGLDVEIDAISRVIADYNLKIDAKNDEIAVTTMELAAAQATEEEQYNSMKLRIKYMYENNDDSYFSLLMTSSDISELLNQAEYVAKVSEYDRGKLEEYVAIKEQVAIHKQTLENEERELQGLKAEQEGELQAVQLLYDAKTKEMDKLEADSKAYSAKQKELEKDRDALDALITKLTNQYNAEQLAKANAVATQSALYAGNLLIWPCPSSYTISSHFSPNRLDPVTGRYYSPHKGMDIAASTGTPVVAAASGLVTAAGYSASMGNYVVISHGDGITTRYYHNSSLVVSAGQAVKLGQTISYVGSTGWSTGPHLHFEVRVNDVPVNPYQFY